MAFLSKEGEVTCDYLQINGHEYHRGEKLPQEIFQQLELEYYTQSSGVIIIYLPSFHLISYNIEDRNKILGDLKQPSGKQLPEKQLTEKRRSVLSTRNIGYFLGLGIIAGGIFWGHLNWSTVYGFFNKRYNHYSPIISKLLFL